MTKDEYFKPYPPELKEKGKKFLDKYKPIFKLVPTNKQSLEEALLYAPIKLFVGTGAGWNLGDPNVIPRTNNPMNHAVTLYAISDSGFHISDQYHPYLKTLAPDYIIYYAFQTFLIRKEPMIKKFIVADGGKLGVMILEGETGVIQFAPTMEDFKKLSEVAKLTAETKIINIPE
jgi:hypothetical protein